MKINKPKVILGSGQFIGVNHLSHARGDTRANQFKNIDNVLNIISTAKDIGYSGIMFSTHPHSLDIISEISKFFELGYLNFLISIAIFLLNIQTKNKINHFLNIN